MKKIIFTTFIALASFGVMADTTFQQEQATQSEANVGGEAPVIVNGDYYEEGATRESDRNLPNQNLNDSRIHYNGEYAIKNVPNVSAPNLTTTLTETCMGSTSVGAGWVGFGASFGTTWRDNACVRRLDARQLQSLGYNLGAKELMCDSDAVRAALKRAGKPCYNDLPDEAKRPADRAPAAVLDDGDASW